MDYERSNQHLIFVIINKFKTIIMKTNRLLRIIVGCVLCAAVMQTTGCTGKEIPGDEKRDTTELFDTVLPFGVERVTISGNGGLLEVGFTPSSDWTFESETPWFKVVTASGTKTDNVLRFSVEAFNEAVGERTAKTFITMGGIRKSVTFKQLGPLRSIVVYGAKVEFDELKSRIDITNILSNVELAVVSTPTWVSDAIVNQIKDSLYSVTLILNGGEIDTKDREGVVVLGDANFEGYTVEVPVSCLGAVSLRVAVTSWDAKSTFPGEGMSDELDGSFHVVTKPGANLEDYRVFVYGTTTGPGNVKSPDWVTGIKDDDIRPLAIYDSKFYEFHLGKYNDKSGAAMRTAHIMAVPISELMEDGPDGGRYLRPINLKPEYVVATINQELYEEYRVVDPLPAVGSEYRPFTIPCLVNTDGSMGTSLATDVVLKIRMAKGLVPQVQVQNAKAYGDNPERVWDGTITKKFVNQGRYDLYTVTLHCKPVTYGSTTTFRTLINQEGRDWAPADPTTGTVSDVFIDLIYSTVL